jgi:hypothetical protein
VALLSGRPAFAATLTVSISNLAEIPVQELRRVQLHAAQPFEAIGVSLRWELARPEAYALPDEGIRVRLLLLSGPQEHRMLVAQQADDRLLGLAVSRARVVYAFCSRILAAVAGRSMNFTSALGRVIAHELGHVVLPAQKGHSDVGIMRAQILVRSERPEFFTAKQAMQIRAFLGTNSELVAAGTAGAGEPGR